MGLGNRLKEYRKQKGYSQEKLAELVAISKMSIRRYETNERQPSLEILNKIATALDIDVWELYNDYGIPVSPDNKNMEIMSDLMENLNTPGQDKAIEQVELLTKIPEYQKKDENTHILVNAAHARTDIEVTEEMKKHDDDIMNDENF